MKLSATLTVIALAVGLSATAQAKDLCKAGAKTDWKPQAELQKKLEADGTKVKRIKVDSGCYEVYGKSKDGKKVESFYHPKTLEFVKEGH